MRKRFLCGALFDGKSDTVLRDQVIETDGQTIVSVGPAHDRAGEESEVIDFSNGFVLPGLVDFHTHLSYGNAKTEEDIDIYASTEFKAVRGVFMAQRVLAAGVTSICDPGGAARVATSIRDGIASGMFAGPRITASGPYLTSHQGLADWYPSWIGAPSTGVGRLVQSMDEAITEIRRQAKDGVDAIKIAMDGMDRRTSSGAPDYIAAFTQEETSRMVAEAHRLGKRVIAHSRGREATLYSARAKVDVLFHASYMDEEGLDAVLENGCAICPTFTFLANNFQFSRPGDPAYRGWREESQREMETAAEVLTKAFRAGVPMLTGTDSGFAITPYGEWHVREIALFVELLGMTPVEALKAATSAPAPYLRDGARLGSIEPGKLADFVVVTNDPLQDLDCLLDKSGIECVVQGGEAVHDRVEQVDQRRISDFSYNMWSDIYTTERVRELGLLAPVRGR